MAGVGVPGRGSLIKEWLESLAGEALALLCLRDISWGAEAEGRKEVSPEHPVASQDNTTTPGAHELAFGRLISSWQYLEGEWIAADIQL